jgi:asparagine synthase (glutamine-hydrolysing)
MCGICGIVNFDNRPVEAPELQQMMNSLKHRGPDDEGFFIRENVGLGNVRLSIIDLSSAGHQPVFSLDRRYCLTYNGEIYNYLELKEILKKKYPFHTRTDTEVVLYAFLEWGPDCLQHFNGMFAFALYDSQTRELFIARDRFGIKPFYYYLDNTTFVFASEERALLPFLPEKKPNPRAIYEYLLCNRTDQGDYTFFQGISKLAHGAAGVVKNRQLKINTWYRLKESLREPFRAPGEFYDALKQSIGLRLRSDVPVGVCLSGGLDSSAIVSILIKDFEKKDLHTFSAVYKEGDAADESEYIEEYRHQPGKRFFIRPTADSLMADLDRFVECHSEPVATLGPYAQFKVMELARQQVKVTLDGQGADEELAGYHYFFGGYFKQLLREFHWGRLLTEMSAYAARYKSLYAFKYFALYLVPASLKDTFSRIAHNFITPGFYREGKKISGLQQGLYHPRNLNDSLLQHFEYKLEHLLKWEDHNSMSHSLESRVPFLDHRLVERTLTLPAEKILHRATTKSFFREAMKGVLPERIRMRHDKIGFATPWDRWFRTPSFREKILELLQSPQFKERGYLDAGKCLAAYRRHLSGKISAAKEIWKWLNLELWLRKFFD